MQLYRTQQVRQKCSEHWATLALKFFCSSCKEVYSRPIGIYQEIPASQSTWQDSRIPKDFQLSTDSLRAEKRQPSRSRLFREQVFQQQPQRFSHHSLSVHWHLVWSGVVFRLISHLWQGRPISYLGMNVHLWQGMLNKKHLLHMQIMQSKTKQKFYYIFAVT